MFFISPELNWKLSFAQYFWNEEFQHNLKRNVGLFNSVKIIDIDKFIQYVFVHLFVCFLGKEQVLKYTSSHGLEIWSLVRFEVWLGLKKISCWNIVWAIVILQGE